MLYQTVRQFFSNPLTEQQQKTLELAQARNHMAEVQAFLRAVDLPVSQAQHAQTARMAANFVHNFLQGLIQRENERES